MIHNNCRYIPYWNGSPYGGADSPQSNHAGDRHHWHECTMHAEMEKRITPEEYDKVTAKFVSEYGYIGPCCKSSIRKYYGDGVFDDSSRIWQLHTNYHEKDTVTAGVEKHYKTLEKGDIESYLLYAGLCQGLMYGYSLTAFRIQEHCMGGMFWMYNDCWGENGWSIIDYYLYRKPSYYFVKRAFENKILALRKIGNEIAVYGANDTKTDTEFCLEYGYMSFDGVKRCKQAKVILPANAKCELLRFADDGFDLANGLVYAKADDSEIRFALLRAMPFRELKLGKAKISICNVTENSFEVTTDKYAHAVHFNLPDEALLSDAYFDLLPGETKTVKFNRLDKHFDFGSLKAESIYNI